MLRRHIVKALFGLPGTLSVSGCGKHLVRTSNNKKIGVALVGLGYYSQDLLAPALQLTQHCELRGIVTGSPEKIPLWREKYGIPETHVYNYQNFDAVVDNPDIDVIYVVLPTSMHKEFTVRAANAGKHVWCEKPMAMSVAECEEMIEACRKNNVQLTIGYRLQHEPNTRDVMALSQTRPFGAIQYIQAEAGFKDARTSYHWRLDPAMGGGAMYDMGVYPLNAARYVTGEEPISVIATQEVHRPNVFQEVEETIRFSLAFPSGAVADCAASFGLPMQGLKTTCAEGWYELKPFQTYTGVKGSASDGREFNKTIINQQATQMDDDALAILHGTKPLVPGEEGLRDIRVVEAVYESVKSGERIDL